MIILATLVLAAVVAWFLIAPHFCLFQVPTGEVRDEGSLVDQKNRSIQVLKDLELDYSTQKISTADYVKTKNELEVELAGIITALEQTKN